MTQTFSPVRRIRHRAPPADGPSVFDPRTLELFLLGAELDEEDAKAAGLLGYVAPLWCLTALPYREPRLDRNGEVPREWVRVNGSVTMRLRPGLVDAGTARERWAYPFGVIPRHLLAWIETEVKRGGDAWHPDTLTLDLGESMNACLHTIGYGSNGGGSRGNATRLADQITRLAYADVIVTDTREDGDGAWNHRGEHFSFIGGVNLWWRDRCHHGDTLFPSNVRLTAEYAASIRDRAVPIDLRALRNLQTANAGALAIDLYYWLVRRVFTLNHGKRNSALVTWQQLASQTGGQYANVRDFKKAVLGKPGKSGPGTLQTMLLAAYPAADVAPTEAGLLVKRSPLPVARRHVIDA
jgi:hypothetical protein